MRRENLAFQHFNGGDSRTRGENILMGIRKLIFHNLNRASVSMTAAVNIDIPNVLAIYKLLA